MTRTHRWQSRGVSLIEVLVSMVVLGVGVMSVVALQMIAKRNTGDAAQQVIAAQLAYDLLERMRFNSTAGGLAAYLSGGATLAGSGTRRTKPSNPDCETITNPPCTPAQLAAYDLWQWEGLLIGETEKVGSTNVGGLLYPTACITGPAGGATGQYTVTIAWRGSFERTATADTCGNLPALYGTSNVFRRVMSVSAYITRTSS